LINLRQFEQLRLRRRLGTVGFNLSRYLQGPGTGMTNVPSFSAIKFSVVLVELPFSSFFLNYNYELLRRFKVEANFSAIGGILRRSRLFYVVRSQIHQLDLGNFVARSTRLHHFVKANDHRVGAGRIKGPIAMWRYHWPQERFVFRDECFLFVPRWRHVRKAPE
jgi:hypothetical protein